MNYHIRLPWEEVKAVAIIAVERVIRNRIAGRNHLYKADGPATGWQLDIEGALGECATARILGIPWDGNGADRWIPDVGSYEVRTTPYRKTGHLLLHPNDKPELPYILACGAYGDYELVGWIFAREGMRREYWKDFVANQRECFWVPQGALRRMEDLRPSAVELDQEEVATFENYDIEKIRQSWAAIGHDIDEPQVKNHMEQLKLYYGK